MISPQAFGEVLRRQREQRGVSLETVAQRTKIGPTFLKALEKGDCSKWPGGIYSRAWIRAYATAIGLDPEDVAGRFAKCFARTAFPEGDPTPPVPADLPAIVPLRLALETDPRERARVLQRRSILFIIDVLVVTIVATTVSAFTVAGFWMVFAGAALSCHGIGLFGGGGSAAGWVDRSLRRYARPHDDTAGASAMEAT
ncbi:MAG: helix-turn-helix domain-containing protein [Acidobacteria bacterium]|nr:helix-turn-helix domain-containing protein [Acidobacteriota bacterium]